MKASKIVFPIILATSFGFCTFAFGEESTTDKVNIMADRTSDATKRNYRAVKDKLCKIVDGKIQCAGKKMKNSMLNATDKAKTDAKEALDKSK